MTPEGTCVFAASIGDIARRRSLKANNNNTTMALNARMLDSLGSFAGLWQWKGGEMRCE